MLGKGQFVVVASSHKATEPEYIAFPDMTKPTADSRMRLLLLLSATYPLVGHASGDGNSRSGQRTDMIQHTQQYV